MIVPLLIMPPREYLNTSLPYAIENQQSVEFIQRAMGAAERLRTGMVGYLGMAAYGSTVRGETYAGSDFDGFVFKKPIAHDSYHSERWGYQQTRVPGYVFDYPRNRAYELQVRAAFLSQGIQRPSVDALPMNHDIVEDQVEYLLCAADIFDETGQDGVFSPHNIRGLFHVPIDAAGLAVYRQQVLDGFLRSPHGETAWSMLRQTVALFEIGRERVVAGEHHVVAHRYLPETLHDACSFYNEA